MTWLFISTRMIILDLHNNVIHGQQYKSWSGTIVWLNSHAYSKGKPFPFAKLTVRYPAQSHMRSLTSKLTHLHR